MDMRTGVLDGVDLSQANWVKAKASQGGNQDCVEVAFEFKDQGVPVRDSKNPTGPALAFSPDAWTSFVAAVQRGELSL